MIQFSVNLAVQSVLAHQAQFGFNCSGGVECNIKLETHREIKIISRVCTNTEDIQYS